MFIAIVRALIQLGGVQAVIDMVNAIASGRELDEGQRTLLKSSQQSLEDRLDAVSGSPAAAAAQPPIGRRIVG